jgi:serine/threonine protein kinase
VATRRHGPLQAGDRVADWIVDAPLGEGAMGAVYRVHSAFSERVEAALKVMKPTDEGDARGLFIREAEALSSLRHPAVVQVMGFHEDARRGLLCLMMELAEGDTLRERFQRGALDLAETLAVFVPLASALEHAHHLGIFHRDLKPANVVLCADGPRLVDFGIALSTQGPFPAPETPMGTLAYLPPEVFRGEPSPPAARDVYALGLLLHEALTGQRAFAVPTGTSPVDAVRLVGDLKLDHGSFDPGPRFPLGVRQAVRHATAATPAQRPGMRELRSSLQSLTDRRGVRDAASGPARGPVPRAEPGEDATTRVPEPQPGRRWVLPLEGAGIALAVAAAALLGWL